MMIIGRYLVVGRTERRKPGGTIARTITAIHCDEEKTAELEGPNVWLAQGELTIIAEGHSGPELGAVLEFSYEFVEQR